MPAVTKSIPAVVKSNKKLARAATSPVVSTPVVNIHTLDFQVITAEELKRRRNSVYEYLIP